MSEPVIFSYIKDNGIIEDNIQKTEKEETNRDDKEAAFRIVEEPHPYLKSEMSKSKKKGGDIDEMLPNLKKIISDLGKDKSDESILIIKRKDIKDPNAHRIRKVSQPKNDPRWKIVKEHEPTSILTE